MFTMLLEVDATETLTRIFRFLFRGIHYFRYPNYVCIYGGRITFSEEGGVKRSDETVTERSKCVLS